MGGEDELQRRLWPATETVLTAARAQASLLGMFFGLADPAGGEAWRPAGELYSVYSADPGGSAGEAGPAGESPLDSLINEVSRKLSGCERRVAASLFLSGYSARLLAPQVGCLVLAGCIPAVPATRLRWRQPRTEMIELALPPGPGWCAPDPILINLVISQTFDEHVEPLTAAIKARVRISADLLRDNVASALIGAIRLLDAQLSQDWRALAAQVLAHPRLAGCGTLQAGEPAFIRRSCCLYYQVEDGGLCGDCPLAR
ncbi:MAG TPA: (2Fe-2S)-binding protein [Streptosporangiaceae bacterium]|nr:(2Fe-2S)-binding protein [Streptosporangiaceae bacterium]